MTEDKPPERAIMLSGVISEEAICPFSKGRWKKVGDAVVFFMLFVTPVLFLLAILITRLY